MTSRPLKGPPTQVKSVQVSRVNLVASDRFRILMENLGLWPGVSVTGHYRRLGLPGFTCTKVPRRPVMDKSLPPFSGSLGVWCGRTMPLTPERDTPGPPLTYSFIPAATLALSPHPRTRSQGLLLISFAFSPPTPFCPLFKDGTCNYSGRILSRDAPLEFSGWLGVFYTVEPVELTRAVCVIRHWTGVCE